MSRNGNDPKSVTDAGPEQPFRCLDFLGEKMCLCYFLHFFQVCCDADDKDDAVDEDKDDYEDDYDDKMRIMLSGA